jgi:hypothetical protein
MELNYKIRINFITGKGKGKFVPVKAMRVYGGADL